MVMVVKKGIGRTVIQRLLAMPAWIFEKPRFEFDRKRGLTLIYTGGAK